MPTVSLAAPKTEAQILAEGQGLKGQNYDRPLASNVTTVTDGTIYFVLVPLRQGDVVTNLHIAVNTASVASTVSKVGIYLPSDSTRQALTADLGTSWQTTGTKTHALTAPYTAPSTGVYWFAAIAKATTTLPTFARQSNLGGVDTAIGSGFAFMGQQTGQTDLIATATVSITTGLALWMGWS